MNGETEGEVVGRLLRELGTPKDKGQNFFSKVRRLLTDKQAVETNTVNKFLLEKMAMPGMGIVIIALIGWAIRTETNRFTAIDGKEMNQRLRLMELKLEHMPPPDYAIQVDRRFDTVERVLQQLQANDNLILHKLDNK